MKQPITIELTYEELQFLCTAVALSQHITMARTGFITMSIEHIDAYTAYPLAHVRAVSTAAMKLHKADENHSIEEGL